MESDGQEWVGVDVLLNAEWPLTDLNLLKVKGLKTVCQINEHIWANHMRDSAEVVEGRRGVSFGGAEEMTSPA